MDNRMSENQWLHMFGDNLKCLLYEANMTQRELAKELEITESAVSRYISGERMPSIFTIINISYILDCDVSEMVDFGSPIW